MCERDLAIAVIKQALADATSPLPEKFDRRGRVTTMWRDRLHDRDQAVLFLTAERGGWARSRNDWCEIAGLDPAVVRETALKQIKEKANA